MHTFMHVSNLVLPLSPLGDQGNIWRKAEIELTNGIYQVVFQAVRGASYLGDIAIDDIAIASGTCPSQGETFT